VEITLFRLRIGVLEDLANLVSIDVSKDTPLKELKSMICQQFNKPDDETTRMWTVMYGRTSDKLTSLTKVIREAYMIRDEVVVVETCGTDGVWPTDAKAAVKTSAGSSAYGASSTGTHSAGGMTSMSSSIVNRTSTIHRGPPGLGNLGNTCFMNSGLQCLLNCKGLVDFFISGKYKQEINRSNAIGCGGKLAEAFAELIAKMRTSSAAVYPYEMKEVISKFAPQFSGYQQHDSQELINFVLDGLHEDLNRISKKPYIEDDPKDELLELPVRAAKQWTNHKRRNDSAVVDLFHFQLKSTLQCPTCHKVGILCLHVSYPRFRDCNGDFALHCPPSDITRVRSYHVLACPYSGQGDDFDHSHSHVREFDSPPKSRT
jgi:hypothetical protein